MQKLVQCDKTSYLCNFIIKFRMINKVYLKFFNSFTVIPSLLNFNFIILLLRLFLVESGRGVIELFAGELKLSRFSTGSLFKLREGFSLSYILNLI